MSSVQKVLAKSGFQFNDSNAEIISGEDEGSYGWITANYLKKVLQEKHKVISNVFCILLSKIQVLHLNDINCG